MTKYRVFAQKKQFEGGEIETYGIADESSFVSVSDITVSYEKALRLCELCGQLGLSPCHLRDVVEDYIISDSY